MAHLLMLFLLTLVKLMNWLGIGQFFGMMSSLLVLHLAHVSNYVWSF